MNPELAPEWVHNLWVLVVTLQRDQAAKPDLENTGNSSWGVQDPKGELQGERKKRRERGEKRERREEREERENRERREKKEIE